MTGLVLAGVAAVGPAVKDGLSGIINKRVEELKTSAGYQKYTPTGMVTSSGDSDSTFDAKNMTDWTNDSHSGGSQTRVETQ